MHEILKLLLKNLIYLGQLFTSRTTESRIIAIRKNKENYQSYASDSAYVLSNDNASYLAIRVPFETKCRFSVLFPKVLSSFEVKYFSEQSWANYFPDDRFVPEDKAENGFFLPWTNEAYGTEDLFYELWSVIKKLPAEVKEIHSDGKYLRVIFHGKTQILASIDKSKVKTNLNNLIATIKKLDVEKTKRIGLMNMFPISDWAYQIGAILFCYLCFTYLMPNIDYIDSKEADKVLIFTIVSFCVILLFLFRKKGFKIAFRLSVLITIFSSFVFPAIYMRLNNELIKEYESEFWTVKGVHPRYARYTRKLNGYNLALYNAGGKRNLIHIDIKKLENITIEKESSIKLDVKIDILGFKFANSAKYPVAGKEIELL